MCAKKRLNNPFYLFIFIQDIFEYLRDEFEIILPFERHKDLIFRFQIPNESNLCSFHNIVLKIDKTKMAAVWGMEGGEAFTATSSCACEVDVYFEKDSGPGSTIDWSIGSRPCHG